MRRTVHLPLRPRKKNIPRSAPPPPFPRAIKPRKNSIGKTANEEIIMQYYYSVLYLFFHSSVHSFIYFALGNGILSLGLGRLIGRFVPSRYLRVLWGEKIGYEDGLRRAGCPGKRRRKNSDWQISIQYGVRSKNDFFFVGL